MANEFTAQQLRDAADTPIYIGSDCFMRKQRMMRHMLSYAADVVERCDKAVAILSKVRSAIDFDCEVGSCGAYCIDPDVYADNVLDNAIDLLHGAEVKEER